MLSSPLIVFTDKVTDTHTDRQTKVITIPHHKICEGVITNSRTLMNFTHLSIASIGVKDKQQNAAVINNVAMKSAQDK